jgi:type II secretory pathway component PulC
MTSRSISWPKMAAVPAVGREIPVRTRIVAVLPAPLGPKHPQGLITPAEKLIVRRDLRDQKEAEQTLEVAIVLGPVIPNDNIEGYFVKPLQSFLMRLREE